MEERQGVVVRLPDGSEDFYANEYASHPTRPSRSLVMYEYSYKLRQGYLFIVAADLRERSDEDPRITSENDYRVRKAVYAPGGWHRVTTAPGGFRDYPESHEDIKLPNWS